MPVTTASTQNKYRLFVILLVAALFLLPGTLRAQGSPAAVVEAFLDAWNVQDYATMYGLLHPQSQQRTIEQIFVTRYEETAAALGLESIEYRIRDTRQQGLSAAVRYDIRMQTGVFGELTEADRLMRLVQDNGQWRIAWTTMDIFEGLAGTARLATSGSTQQRANIYDRDGLPLATQGTMIGFYAIENNMPSVEDCQTLLADLMNEYIQTTRDRFLPWGPETRFNIGWLPEDIYNANLNRLTSTCAVEPEFSGTSTMRTYFGGNIMGHVVGYIGQISEAQQQEFVIERGYEPGALIGQYGIEAAYEETLAGRPNRTLRIVGPGGGTLREIATAQGSAPQPVSLTLDRRLQAITAEAMADAYNNASGNWGAWRTTDRNISAGGSAVVLDVNTGAVLALVSYPLIDPTVFNPNAPIFDRGAAVSAITGDTRQPLLNRATQATYSPGSVYKIITHAAILNEGLIGNNDLFECDLFWDGRPLGDTVPEPRADWRVADDLPAAGTVTPAQALMSSCNPFYWEYGGVYLFNDVTPDAVADYSRRMGMGPDYDLQERFGIPESAAQLVDPSGITAAINASTGQGDVQVPPIQMAVAVASIANGGTVYEPYLVEQVGGFDGTPVSFTAEPTVMNTLDFEPGVLENIQAGMCGVTTNPDYGTAYIRFGDPTGEFHPQSAYTVCGKTGTAEATPQPPNAWFVAYAPRDNPQIAVMVMAQNSREGSQVAAPITRRILDEYFNVPASNYADWPEWWSEEGYIPLTPTGQSAGQ